MDAFIERLTWFLTKLEIETADTHIYAQAFLHRSWLNERKDHFDEHNERLEFLGDAVLELVVSEKLYQDFPDKPEGWMTDIRSSLVRGKHLGDIAGDLGFSEFVLLSRWESAAWGANNPSILADVFEAFLGAIYLDKGFENAKNFILEHVFWRLDTILEEKHYVDPKSALQELTQAHDGSIPEYEVLEESGMDHEKEFVIGVNFLWQCVGKWKWSSKKKAQEGAAADALAKKWDWLQ